MIGTFDMRWAPHLFSLEIRKVLTYRVDFWLNLICSLFSKVGLAYFVWKEIFALRGVETIAGYSFHALMMYYVITAFVYEINALDLGYFSGEIYDGALTRYLIFPLSFFTFKYVTRMARASVHFVQIGIVIAVVYVWVGIPAGVAISPTSTLLGILATLLASYLTFVMAACLELICFWVDKVWSLGVMLQLTSQFLGGVYIPVSAFPESMQSLLHTLPFYFVAAFPVRVFFGEVSRTELLTGLGLSFVWAVLFTLIARAIWRRGMLQYSGVGQ